MKIFSINFVTLLLLSAAQNQDQTQDQEKVPVQIEEETEMNPVASEQSGWSKE
ncbi:MAG: hypothetical protein QGF46_08285 [Planctomycetota bacterium]|nr:hypothetical protein [Planctomycetota bacterium]